MSERKLAQQVLQLAAMKRANRKLDLEFREGNEHTPVPAHRRKEWERVFANAILDEIAVEDEIEKSAAYILSAPAEDRTSREKFSAKEWALALQSLTPGGSEFLTPAECVAFVHKRTAYPRMIIELREQKAALLAALENFLRAITSGNLSLGKNPYCISEFKAAMVAVADAHGKDSTGSKWMDALGEVKVPE